ncbi:MAG: DNA polymerase III subunit delta [Chloroflexi bacterium ADurb.Bin344]|nr:MAG: DNA polymerase III subunit delta [Chloroflexi bacterium ADurb.Bin344]
MDIQELVTGSASVSIFDMVDALASGNAKEAFRTLDLLMQDQEIPVLFAMIIRQFRLLIQTREIMDEKGNIATVQDELNQHPFVAEKLWRQASRFRFLQLKSIYRKLVEMDFAFKTSQPDSRAALDVLIADISLMVQD